MTNEESILEFYRKKAEQMIAGLQQKADYPKTFFGYDSGSTEGDISPHTVSCGPGVTADELRKAIHDIKKQDLQFRPPSAILLYGSAYDDLLRSMPMEPFVADPGGLKFKVGFEGIPITRMLNSVYLADAWGPSSAPAMKPVVWRDEVPVEAIPMWQYEIVALVVGLLLVMLGGAF